MSERKIRDIGAKDIENFRVFNLEGKMCELKDITNVEELQVLLAREISLREPINQKLIEFRQFLIDIDTDQYLDLEFEDQ